MSEYVPCPNCNTPDPSKVNFTWWGGLIGPRLFTHVKCNSCRTTYNGKTGKSNSGKIAIYFLVILAIVILIGVIGAAK